MDIYSDDMGRNLIKSKRYCLESESLVGNKLNRHNESSGKKFLSKGHKLRSFDGLEYFKLDFVRNSDKFQEEVKIENVTDYFGKDSSVNTELTIVEEEKASSYVN